MLAVYDRVIPSGSVPTLVALVLLATATYGLQALIDIFRSRMLSRIGFVIKESLGGRSFDVIIRTAVKGDLRAGSTVRDLDQVQGFLSSLAPTALFDLPWIPLYLGICFAFDFWIGATVTAGALVLIGLTVLSNVLTKPASEALAEDFGRRAALLAASQGNAETISAMGMTAALGGKWTSIDRQIIGNTERIADTSGVLGTTSRVARMLLQSLVLAVGAYLVIMQEATGGIMIASSVLSSRALAPIELAIANWKNFLGFRQSWSHLEELLAQNPAESTRFPLPRPERSFTCDRVSVALPGRRQIVVHNVSFALKSGESLGIIGATGSGKSSLARALVGLWPTAGGQVRLDGHELNRWTSTERGRFIGYLPQNVSLFEGTIAENIARFDPEAKSADIVSAAKAAGVHGLISRLPEGYDSMIGENGGGLSGGQAQRVGLARALYGEPFLVVLDEPNSNLDAEGEAALQLGMDSVRARGGTIIVVAHRPSILAGVGHVMVMSGGQVQRYGSREEVLELLTSRVPVQQGGPA